MKETLVVAAAVAALAVAAAPTAGAGSRLPPAAPAGQLIFYGHIKSLTPSGGRYLLRFDPAWLLEGTTAEKAAVADGVLPPGQPVPNDNYTRDESHKLLTFVVPPTARVTVLTRGIHATPVTVAEFAQLLKGRNPKPLADEIRDRHLYPCNRHGEPADRDDRRRLLAQGGRTPRQPSLSEGNGSRGVPRRPEPGSRRSKPPRQRRQRILGDLGGGAGNAEAPPRRRLKTAASPLRARGARASRDSELVAALLRHVDKRAWHVARLKALAERPSSCSCGSR